MVKGGKTLTEETEGATGWAVAWKKRGRIFSCNKASETCSTSTPNQHRETRETRDDGHGITGFRHLWHLWLGPLCLVKHAQLCVSLAFSQPSVVGTMPRRSRPWCSSSARSRPSAGMLVSSVARGAAGLVMITARISTAFVQIQHGHTPSFAPTISTSTAVPASAWPTLEGRGSTSSRRHCGDAMCALRRRSCVDTTMLLMALQQQQEETEEATTTIAEYAAALAEGSAAGTAVAKPFVTRKLGSFEKMLTQTRDGVGPAEEGIRTLLTPHVWVSVLGSHSVSGSSFIRKSQ